MTNYSALHYAAKAEKANLLAQEAAEKAKVDADRAQAIKDSIGTVYKYRGSVDTVADLPGNAEQGDVYDVIETGSNYAWTGTGWDALGVTADLSAYLRASGTAVFQDGTLTIKGDNHPLVIEGMAGTSATGLQVKDSLGAGETDLEHYATGDRYGSRLVNRTAAGNEGVLDLYTTTAGVSILDATDVSSVLVPTAALGDATNRAASTEFVTNAMLDKADADGSNFTAEAKEVIVGWGKPDYSAEISISSPYTPTQNGFISLCVTGAYTHLNLNEDGINIISQYDDVAGANQQNILRLIPIAKGKTYSWTYVNGTLTYAKFTPSFGG